MRSGFNQLYNTLIYKNKMFFMQQKRWVVLGVLISSGLLAASLPKAESAPPIVGADRDAHGCIGSAGYAWCECTQACERPWELAEKEDFELSIEAFHAFCQQSK